MRRARHGQQRATPARPGGVHPGRTRAGAPPPGQAGCTPAGPGRVDPRRTKASAPPLGHAGRTPAGPGGGAPPPDRVRGAPPPDQARSTPAGPTLVWRAFTAVLAGLSPGLAGLCAWDPLSCTPAGSCTPAKTPASAPINRGAALHTGHALPEEEPPKALALVPKPPERRDFSPLVVCVLRASSPRPCQGKILPVIPQVIT
ncbi:hypothetical protein Taro_008113 [Colocasia esculenta]|uniref:Uncharacterized protein n=1 Tax=Colocasia esculenta TaxID=4460 RepID=A0A843U074_COLES|nr:hypothetical protein [Colocasia esculenta]